MIPFIYLISGGNLEDGRMDLHHHHQQQQQHHQQQQQGLYGPSAGSASLLVPSGPRSSASSSSSSMSPPSHHNNNNNNHSKMTSNGTSGRKYQCKMCPQVNHFLFLFKNRGLEKLRFIGGYIFCALQSEIFFLQAYCILLYWRL